MDIDTYDDHPNFSVIVPQECNAHCDFCSNADVDEMYRAEWMKGLREAIDLLPAQFRSVTITGGEPTLFVGLETAMFWLRKRFEKVVVSTNGVRLGEMGFVLKHANAVNLSWHGWSTPKALAVFGDKGMKPPDPNAIVALRQQGTGVTLTWVVTLKRGGITPEDVTNYVALAEKLGCSAAAFRYDMREPDGLTGDWIPALPNSYALEGEGGCPSCHTWRYERRGFPVFFKASVMEPTEVMDKPYEVVYTAKGVLSYDWAGQKPVEGEDMTEQENDRLDKLASKIDKLIEVMGLLAGVRDEDYEVETVKKPKRRPECVEHHGSGGCNPGGGRC